MFRIVIFKKMPTDYLLRECTSISFSIQLLLYDCPLQQTDWICVSSATADEPLRPGPSRVECTACRPSVRHSLQHAVGLGFIYAVFWMMNCGVQIRKFVPGCEAVTALMKTSLLGCYAVSKGRNANIFRVKSKQHPEHGTTPPKRR
jgi:hypothetical protein